MAFGIPIAFDFRVPGGPLGAGSVGLAIVAAAYMAETIRAGGIVAYPTDSCYALGCQMGNKRTGRL